MGINPVVQYSAAVVASSRVRCGLPGGRIICAEFRPVGAAGLVVNESAERNGAQLLHRHRAGGGEIRRGVGGDGDHRLPQALGQNSALVYPHHAFIAGGPGDGLVLEGPGVNRCGQGVGRALKQRELVVADGNPAGSLRRGDVAVAGGDDVQAGSLHIHPGGRSGILAQVIIRIGLLSPASLQIEKKQVVGLGTFGIGVGPIEQIPIVIPCQGPGLLDKSGGSLFLRNHRGQIGHRALLHLSGRPPVEEGAGSCGGVIDGIEIPRVVYGQVQKHPIGC